MRILRLSLLVAVSAMAAAQVALPAQPVWQMQNSGTTAGLRGIDSVDGKVAWANGMGSTALRTTDRGAHWQKCAVPDAATDGATLEFRGVQAWDAETAILIAPKLNGGVSTDPCFGIDVPIRGGNESSGVFSVAIRDVMHLVAVSGDYKEANEKSGISARTAGDWRHWLASTTPPHGYRSTGQWSEPLKVWITAGTNGSDISRDDGRTWQLLDNGNWNALSLPFIVGPNGRIARLNPTALPQSRPEPRP
ncbi:MAG TPA: hypothetical protein VGT08_00740 [Terracidiphilus sp.]|nr:hypothetical protein [Terracidiphilus sp.]